LEAWTDKLIRAAAASDSTHVNFDEKRSEWTFKVKHFTRYGLVASDDEDEEEVPVKQVEAPQPKNMSISPASINSFMAKP